MDCGTLNIPVSGPSTLAWGVRGEYVGRNNAHKYVDVNRVMLIHGQSLPEVGVWHSVGRSFPQQAHHLLPGLELLEELRETKNITL